MPTARKPRSAHLTREDVEAMIAEAVAAERARSETAMAGLLLALGGAGQAMGEMAEALAGAGRTLDLHSALLGPLADAFAAGADMADAADSPTPN